MRDRMLWWTCIAALLAVADVLPAQDLDGELRLVQRLVDSRSWADAVARLQAARQLVVDASGAERVALLLDTSGDHLMAADEPAQALLAFTTACEVLRKPDPEVATEALARCLERRATALLRLQRPDEARASAAAASAIADRLHGDQDHWLRARTMVTLSQSLEAADEFEQADPLRRAGGRMAERLLRRAQTSFRSGDAATALQLFLKLQDCGQDPVVRQFIAARLSDLGTVFVERHDFERAHAALSAALELQRALKKGGDDPLVAKVMNNLGSLWMEQGRPEKARSLLQASLEMRQRLAGGRPDKSLIVPFGNLANCCSLAGREDDARRYLQNAAALAEAVLVGGIPARAPDFNTMWGALPDVAFAPIAAVAFYNLGVALSARGAASAARPLLERALAFFDRHHGDAPHPDRAQARSALGSCLATLGERERARALAHEAVALAKAAAPGGDHPVIAECLGIAGAVHLVLGQPAAAADAYQEALVVLRRIHGPRDHRNVAEALTHHGDCLLHLGEPERAMQQYLAAGAAIDRLRRAWGESAWRQGMFDRLKRFDTFERLQRVAVELGRADEAFLAAERSRARDLLDLLEQQVDPLLAAERRARAEGNRVAEQRIERLRAELAATDARFNALLHELAESGSARAEPDPRRRPLADEVAAVARRREALLDERAEACMDQLPVGSVRDHAAVQSILQEGELFLEYTCTARLGQAYLIGPSGPVMAYPLPDAHAAAARALPGLLAACSRGQLEVRGRDPDGGRPPQAELAAAGRDLFAALVPEPMWHRIRGARRIFLAPHRELFRVPFEVLVVALQDGEPVYWLDRGPPIAYVPSGSALHWLRQHRNASATPAEIDLLAIGDPSVRSQEAPQVPGLRTGELDQMFRLGPLPGARREATAIVDTWARAGHEARLLLGTNATESAVHELAPKSRFLHFACHGIASELAEQSFSLLVLAQPTEIVPGDDGLLQLVDLLQHWHRRLDACELVVLSSCRTNVGPTFRDEAPHALPVGLLFAGARAVISTLWSVDDSATEQLMTDFYARLSVAGDHSLAAFTAARRKLRGSHPDPYYWAPFLFVGLPRDGS